MIGAAFELVNCFNTQPPEGGWMGKTVLAENIISFNTQPPEGGWNRTSFTTPAKIEFQHTAARRRLGAQHTTQCAVHVVSTHSRPKAAGQ